MTAKQTKRDTSSNPVATAVGKEIKKLRAERSMNQTDFAASTGIKQAMDSRYEAGKETPGLPTLIRIAAGFANTHKGVGELILGIIGPAIAIVANEFWGESKPAPKPKSKTKPAVKAVKIARKARARAAALDAPDVKPKRKHRATRTTVTAPVASPTAALTETTPVEA